MTHVEKKEIRRKVNSDMKQLRRFRTGCLVGLDPSPLILNGMTFKDELEAEGYLAELDAYLLELEDEPITS